MHKLLLLLFGLPALLTLCDDAAGEPLRSAIDAHIQTAWLANKITPAEPASDAEFLRRIHLDLHGVIPTYDQAIEFLADASPDKREKLIDRLLDDPRYAVHSSDIWDMVLFGRNPPGFYARVRPDFKRWVREQFEQNVAYDKFVEAMLKAEGNTIDDGAPTFLIQYDRKPEDAAVAVTKNFLGVQLECARCHDHPFEDYTQVDFYGMAAFYARLEWVEVGKKGKDKKMAAGEKNLGDVLFTGPAIDQKPGQKGEPVPAKFMKGDAVVEPELPEGFEEPRRFPSGKAPPKPKFSRKDTLAAWIATADNPFFAHAAANRIWGQFMGKGIVHPVDDMRPSNPPSHPELLDALTKYLVDNQFDLKSLICEIVNSKTYQLSSGGAVEIEMPLRYERARYRPLSAEELYESWQEVGGINASLAAAGQKPDEKRFAIKGMTWDYFRRYFGYPTDGAGNFQGGISEHLFLNNGQVHQMITKQKGGLHETMSKSEDPWDERVERMFVQVLSRRPTMEEVEEFVAHLSAPDDASNRLHEAIWTLMTCSEFRFNH